MDQLIKEKKKVFDLDMERESQFSQLKRLLKDVLKNPDSPIPLKDRLKLLFKAFGVTIASIIAAIAMVFTTIGLSISNALKGSSGGSKPAPKPDPKSGPKPDPKPDPSITDRVKEGLKKFAKWLMYLAGKSAAALPGIISSILSFLLKTIASVAGFMSEHIIIFLFIVVSSIIYGLIKGVKEIGLDQKNKASIKKSRNRPRPKK